MHGLLMVVLAVAPVAWVDRAGWPQPVSTVKDFDRASRAEVLVFVEALSSLPLEVRGNSLAQEVGLKHGDLGALEAWKRSRKALLLENFRRGAASCSADDVLCPAKLPESFAALATSATPMLESLPDEYATWRTKARQFHATHVRELARLAMLSSKVSSEIARLDDAEVTGEAFGDREFLLTFDDGPTGAAGETDALLPVLKSMEQHAVFFVVGDAMHARKPEKALYDGHCVGSHGSSHQSHVTSPKVAAQLDPWNQELASSMGPVRWFRPPYGQRTLAQTQALSKQGISVMLWNLDSQDWQAPKDTALVEGRVLTLMLLWRRGVVLFHDVHPVAKKTLPGLVSAVSQAVTWRDCRKLSSL